VIAPIDDDPDSACDFDEPEPGPSWFDCPMLPRGDMLAIIERKKDLDGRAINLFRSAEMAIEPVLGNGMRSFTNVSR
jgi:hypothetical protein